MVRPHVVTFMDRLLRDPESNNRIEEVEVLPGSNLEGKTLADSKISSRANLLVLAVQPPGEGFRCNPPATERIRAGTLLVILGDRADFETVRKMAGHREEPVA